MLATAVWFVVDRYGGSSFLPGLVAGFIGTLFAFLLALTWERYRDAQRLKHQDAELEKLRATEIRRRLELVRTELAENEESLAFAARSLASKGAGTAPAPPSVSSPAVLEGSFAPINPQLLEGAWVANAPRLSQLVANYRLISDLATTYGRIEELRWRLRVRTERQTTLLDDITEPLAAQLVYDVGALLQRVQQQIESPDVQRLGLVHEKGSFGSSWRAYL